MHAFYLQYWFSLGRAGEGWIQTLFLRHPKRPRGKVFFGLALWYSFSREGARLRERNVISSKERDEWGKEIPVLLRASILAP